jgi:crossover junction endodeoxyribonuclease RuvC
MRALGLDLGTHLGYALSDNGALASGEWDLSQKRHEGNGMRFIRFRKYLNDIGKVDVIYYEEVARHLGTDAAHVYGGLLAQLFVWCDENNVPYKGIPVGTIKKCATGKGNANKDAMIRAAQQSFPSQLVETDNQADALWILETGLRDFHGESIRTVRGESALV